MTPSDILDFTYCKRRWYLHHIENIHNDNHILLIEGTKAHETVDEYHKTIRNGIMTITAMQIYSFKYNIRGICDTVEIQPNDTGNYISMIDHNADVIVIEKKHGKVRDCFEYKSELTAQILCLEEMLDCKIEYGYINYVESDKCISIEIDDTLRNHVQNVIRQINEYYESPYLIKPVYSRKCKGCSVCNICCPRKTNIDEYLKLLWEEGDRYE